MKENGEGKKERMVFSMGNIVGLDLNVDKDYLEEAVKQTVLMGIAESLNGKNEIVSQIVKMVLSTRVDNDGQINSYEAYNKQTLLSFYVKKMIRAIAEDELKKLDEEHREEITKIIRIELQKKANYSKFVDSFITSVAESVSERWRPQISIQFEGKEDY